MECERKNVCRTAFLGKSARWTYYNSWGAACTEVISGTVGQFDVRANAQISLLMFAINRTFIICYIVHDHNWRCCENRPHLTQRVLKTQSCFKQIQNNCLLIFTLDL